MTDNPITGIILSGGKSSRMGEEKGLAMLNNKPLITYALSAIEPLCTRVLISANQHQADYLKFGHEVVPDKHSSVGPLAGLSACLERSTTQLNVVLSCDVPFVNEGLFSYLLSQHDNQQLVVPVHDGFIEPLCGIYATNVLWYVNEAIAKQDFKMMHIVEALHTLKVDIDASLDFYTPDLFANINTQKDLKGGGN